MSEGPGSAKVMNLTICGTCLQNSKICMQSFFMSEVCNMGQTNGWTRITSLLVSAGLRKSRTDMSLSFKLCQLSVCLLTAVEHFPLTTIPSPLPSIWPPPCSSHDGRDRSAANKNYLNARSVMADWKTRSPGHTLTPVLIYHRFKRSYLVCRW